MEIDPLSSAKAMQALLPEMSFSSLDAYLAPYYGEAPTTLGSPSEVNIGYVTEVYVDEIDLAKPEDREFLAKVYKLSKNGVGVIYKELWPVNYDPVKSPGLIVWGMLTLQKIRGRDGG